MASRQALAPKLYKRFLQVCEQWPVDQKRLGRDLGEHLKGNLVPRIKNSQIDVSIRLYFYYVSGLPTRLAAARFITETII